MQDRINVTRSSLPSFDEYTEEIRSIWDSCQLTNCGEKHNALEKALEAYFGVPCVTLFANGHLALEAVLRAYSFPAGGEVITTPFTFASTTNAIIRCGLTPVFCDVRQEDLTLDPERLRGSFSGRTVAVLPVHVYGNICDTDTIEEIAAQHGVPVIYDAAHTFGVRHGGVSSAALGDASVFSFHATKVFNTIEGGAVCLRDESLCKRLQAERNFGICEGDYILYGGNAKMNEFQAAMGLCNLRHIDSEIEKRRQVYRVYKDRLSSVEGLRIPLTGNEEDMNFAYMPLLFDGYKYTRDRVAELLSERSIYPRKYFYPITSELLGVGQWETDLPVAKRAADTVLTLPMYADLSVNDAHRICDIILK